MSDEQVSAVDQKAQKAQAKARADQANQDAAKPLDQTVPGGRYLVNDQLVDANGTPIKE